MWNTRTIHTNTLLKPLHIWCYCSTLYQMDLLPTPNKKKKKRRECFFTLPQPLNVIFQRFKSFAGSWACVRDYFNVCYMIYSIVVFYLKAVNKRKSQHFFRDTKAFSLYKPLHFYGDTLNFLVFRYCRPNWYYYGKILSIHSIVLDIFGNTSFFYILHVHPNLFFLEKKDQQQERNK